MDLHKLAVTHLQLLESGAFFDRYATDVKNTGIDLKTDPDLFGLHQSLLDQSPTFQDALLQVRAKLESQAIAVADIHRDHKITTLRRAHSVFQYTDDPNEKKAYDAIHLLLNKFEGLEYKNYEAESLGIETLVSDFRTAPYLAFAQLLKLEVHVDNLEKSNDAFKALFNKRSSDTIVKVVYDAKSLRKNITATYKEIADYVLVMAKRKKTPYYTTLLNAINNGRKYFADLLAKREGVANANKEGENPSTPTTPPATI